MTIRLWRDDRGDDRDDGDPPADDRIAYAFGTEANTAGRVAVDPDSGDIEIVHLNDEMPPPGAKFYLAAVVPRLQRYHDAGSFPDTDAWET